MATRSSNEPITMGNYSDLPPEQRPGYYNPGNAPSYSYNAAAPSTTPGVAYAPQSNVQYSTQQFGYTATPSSAHARENSNGGFQYANPPDKLTYTAKPAAPSQQQPPPVRHTPQPSNPPYQQSAHPQYTSTPQSPHPQYNTAPPPAPPPPQQQQQHHAVQPSYPPPPPMGAHAPHPGNHHRAGSNNGITNTHDGRKVVEMVPSGGGKINAPPSPGMRPHSLSVGGGDRPDGLSGRMNRLSVSGNRPDVHMVVPGGFPGGAMGGGLPPPSPLLEAYHGTYQSISPMPGAMLMDDDLDHIPSLDSLSPRDPRDSGKGRRRAHSTSRRSPSRRSPSPPYNSRPKDRLALEAYGRADRAPSREPEKRRVKIYDATEDAYALVDAMSGKVPDASVLIEILPTLSHDQMLELRSEYKRHCKVQGRGINIAKHIKLKTSGNFGKIAYVTALGKYEGEGYWANYWYQSNSAKRELLIEALMGRQNHEIREIKDAFKDKRYSDNLEKCMDKELKADKFRKAVLMALKGHRQEESDVFPPEYMARDVDTLHQAIRAREGGETAMLDIVCMRSDAHLREVLRRYERSYHSSFARDALRKSNNLVVSHHSPNTHPHPPYNMVGENGY
jgi:hypothetical protein